MDIKQLFSLEDKVVLITGGAGLYGKFVFQALAEAGATAITASRTLEAGDELAAKLRERGLKAYAMIGDQADHASIIELKERIKSEFGRLDVFVNNAVARPMRKYTDPLEAWEKSMEINATGMFDILREMAALIAESGGGSIVNIGSMQGVYGADFSLYEGTDMDSPPDYHFHKGGMVSLTKYLARKLAPQKIRVNCISPGGLFTGQPEAFVEKYSKKVPLGRMASDDDLKGVVVFFASDASSYITGENLVMDGGLHC